MYGRGVFVLFSTLILQDSSRSLFVSRVRILSWRHEDWLSQFCIYLISFGSFKICRGTSSFSWFLGHEFSVVRIAVIIFTILVAVVLLNLLVAQLNMAYQLAHSDMEGYARLTRASIIVTTVEQVSRKRWRKFLQTLNWTSWKSCHQWLFNTAWQMGNAEFNSPDFEKTRHAGTWENAKESEFWAALGV